MKHHIYNAGPLFTNGEIKERMEEDLKLQKLKSTGEYTFYNPITAPCNDKEKLPTAEDIFMGDTKEVVSADVIIANLDHEDPGVMAELGIAWGLEYSYKTLYNLYRAGIISRNALASAEEFGIKPKKVIAVDYDLRQATAGEYNGRYVPVGRNQFVIGMIEDFEDETIVDNFDNAIALL